MPLTGFLLPWGFVSFAGALTLAGEHAFKYLRSTGNGGNQNVTVPPFSAVPLAEGVQLSLEQVGTSTITLVPGAGVTINSRGALLVSNGPFAVISLVRSPVLNVWTAFGDLV